MNTRFFSKLLAALCLALAVCLVVPALVPGVVVPARAASSIKLNKTRASVYNGKTLQLKVTGTKKAVKWSSSDKSVARVNASGLVTPRKVGKATITAKVGKTALTCAVTVQSPLTTSVTSVTLKPGKSKKITLNWKLAGSLSVKTPDASVLKCRLSNIKNKKCVLTIKALRPGTETITVKNSKTSDVVKIKVKVSEAKTDTPIVDKTSVTVKVGGSAKVKVTWPYGGVPACEYSYAVKTAWGAAFTGGWPMTITGVEAGQGYVKLYKSEDGQPVGDPLVTIKVTVK